MPHRGSSPSDYTAPVSEEERQAWIGVFDKNLTSPPGPVLLRPEVVIFLVSLGMGLALLYLSLGIMFWFWELLLQWIGGTLSLTGLLGGAHSLYVQSLRDPAKMLREGVIVNRILNTYTDVLVRKYAQCSHVDEYGHKRFDDDRWQKEETKFKDTVWVPEASKFMSDPKYYIENQDRLVNIIWAEYEGRKTGIIATFREDMNPFDYEHFCAAILNENGWNARATQGSGDQGVDVIAEKDACRVAIQCKLYSSNVGNKAVQEIIAGSIHVDADYRVVVSNRDYTKSAYEIAEKSKVRLLHHNDLQDLDRALGLASV